MKSILLKNKYWIYPQILWTILAILSLSWSLYLLNHNSHVGAIERGRDMVKLIEITRLWNSNHKGVYVSITNDTEPNQYLNIPERDVTTTNGLKLTMINPSYMTRQISELTYKDLNIKFHLTSLKLIRSANKPDNWEETALREFDQGKTEKLELVGVEPVREYRYMEAQKVKQSCLECHKDSGYKIGDIAGGLSVTFSAEPVLRWQKREKITIFIAHLFIYILVTYLALNRVYHIRLKINALNKIKDKQKQTITERTSEMLNAKTFSYNVIESMINALIVVNPDHTIVMSNQSAREMLSYTKEELSGRLFSSILKEKEGKGSTKFDEILMKGSIRNEEKIYITKDGSEIPVLFSASVIFGDNGIQGIVCIAQDIAYVKRAIEILGKKAIEP
jgi:PAS domain S-box-containing protein